MAKLSDINILSIGNTITMVGVLFGGEDKVYLAMYPSYRGDVFSGQGQVLFQESGSDVEQKVDVLDLDADDWKKVLDQSDQLNTEVLARAADGTMEKAILRKSQRSIEMGVQWKVFKRDRYACRYCANDATPLTVDHLVLWEDGGPSIETNLVSACRRCNKSRGSMSFDQWLVSPYYLRVSKGLSDVTRAKNIEVASTLGAIPRLLHIRSR